MHFQYFYMLYHSFWPSNWFIIVCPWRTVYLLETSVVLFGAQWFLSLVPVHLLLLSLYCYSIVDAAVAFLLLILLTLSFPIKLMYLAIFSLFWILSKHKWTHFNKFEIVKNPLYNYPLKPCNVGIHHRFIISQLFFIHDININYM